MAETMAAALFYAGEEAGKGRVLRASVDVAPGKELLREAPLLLIPQAPCAGSEDVFES